MSGRMSAASRSEERGTHDDPLLGFEAHLAEELPYIPFAVRYKLDRAGCRISLAQWLALPLEQRRALLHDWRADDRTALAEFRDALLSWVKAVSDEPVRECPALVTGEGLENPVPAGVADSAREFGLTLGAAEWNALTPFARYLLAKLAAARQDRARFRSALLELRGEDLTAEGPPPSDAAGRIPQAGG